MVLVHPSLFFLSCFVKSLFSFLLLPDLRCFFSFGDHSGLFRDESSDSLTRFFKINLCKCYLMKKAPGFPAWSSISHILQVKEWLRQVESAAESCVKGMYYTHARYSLLWTLPTVCQHTELLILSRSKLQSCFFNTKLSISEFLVVF